MNEIKKVVTHTPTTDAEKIQMGEELTATVLELQRLEEERKSEMQRMRDEIQALKTNAERLASLLDAGMMEQEVEAEIIYNMPEIGMKRVISLDNGEIIEEKEMTNAEKKHAQKLADGKE